PPSPPLSFFLQRTRAPCPLPLLPTRRSSDLLLGVVAEGQRGGQASDVRESFYPGGTEDRRMVSAEPAPADPGATRDAEPEIAWSRQLLWGHREQSSPGEPAVRGGTDLAEVAQPTVVGWVVVVGALRAGGGARVVPLIREVVQ